MLSFAFDIREHLKFLANTNLVQPQVIHNQVGHIEGWQTTVRFWHTKYERPLSCVYSLTAIHARHERLSRNSLSKIVVYIFTSLPSSPCQLGKLSLKLILYHPQNIIHLEPTSNCWCHLTTSHATTIMQIAYSLPGER